MAESTVVVGVFADQTQAEQAMKALKRAHFRDIGFVVRQDEATTEALPAIKVDEKVLHLHPLAGALSGGTVGGVVGAVVAFLLPNLGQIVVGGILTTVLGGLALGGAAGALVAAFASIGVAEDEAQGYERDVHAGRIIVIVQAEDRPMEAFHILEQYRFPGVTQANREYLAEASMRDPEATVKMEAVDDQQPA